MGLSDYRAALHYLRTTPDGRIAFGIGGHAAEPGPSPSARGSPTTSRRCRWRPRDLHRMFPTFARRVDRRGVGRADRRRRARICRSSAPSSTARCTTGMGYTGNGVGPAHLGGRILANRSLGRYDDVLDLPIVEMRVRCWFPPRADPVPRCAHREPRDPSQGRVRGPRRGSEPARGFRGEAAAPPGLQPRALAFAAGPRAPRPVLVVDGPGTHHRCDAVDLH